MTTRFEAAVEAAWKSLLDTAVDVTTRDDIRVALTAALDVLIPTEEELAQTIANAYECAAQRFADVNSHDMRAARAAREAILEGTKHAR